MFYSDPRIRAALGLPWTMGALFLLGVTAWMGASTFASAAVSNGPVGAAFLAGLVAATATAIGTVPVVVPFQCSTRASDAMLCFGSGMMIAASTVSMLIPAFVGAIDHGAGAWGSGLIVALGLLLGAAVLHAVMHALPQDRGRPGNERPYSRALRTAWLFVLAISLHNVTEGWAIGAAFVGADRPVAHALALGVAIQDIPEGLLVAWALRSIGYSRSDAVSIGIASGLLEPLSAVAGALFAGISVLFVPLSLSAAAGAMLLVIGQGVLPRSHRREGRRWANGGLALGFVAMVILNAVHRFSPVM